MGKDTIRVLCSEFLFFITVYILTTLSIFFVFALQVVIGGRSKYLINGVNAANSRVQDLFCSIGLNVNNPHFLIMQVLCASL